jgi:DNA-binding HxlR family transcriptional regulator
MRLRELENLGLLLREVLHTSPPSVRYSLTQLGREFEPVLEKILEVGLKLQKNPA